MELHSENSKKHLQLKNDVLNRLLICLWTRTDNHGTSEESSIVKNLGKTKIKDIFEKLFWRAFSHLNACSSSLGLEMIKPFNYSQRLFQPYG